MKMNAKLPQPSGGCAAAADSSEPWPEARPSTAAATGIQRRYSLRLTLALCRTVEGAQRRHEVSVTNALLGCSFFSTLKLQNQPVIL
jgi:hypothetical protein